MTIVDVLVKRRGEARKTSAEWKTVRIKKPMRCGTGIFGDGNVFLIGLFFCLFHLFHEGFHQSRWRDLKSIGQHKQTVKAGHAAASFKGRDEALADFYTVGKFLLGKSSPVAESPQDYGHEFVNDLFVFIHTPTIALDFLEVSTYRYSITEYSYRYSRSIEHGQPNFDFCHSSRL